mgnify:CR=1 FL=1
MICPYCSSGDTKVVDSRENEGSFSVRRRRECEKCEKRFTTYEKCDMEIKVTKRDGRKEDFDRNKLRMGITKACIKRPVTLETVDHLINKLEARLRNEGNEITSEFIGNVVMQELKKIDKIAYMRFASVYRGFDDIQSFEKEARLLTH